MIRYTILYISEGLLVRLVEFPDPVAYYTKDSAKEFIRDICNLTCENTWIRYIRTRNKIHESCTQNDFEIISSFEEETSNQKNPYLIDITGE